MSLFGLTFLFLLVNEGVAADLRLQSVAKGQTANITAFGSCLRIQNLSDYSLFVPTGSLAEWKAFAAAAVPKVNKSYCSAPAKTKTIPKSNPKK